MQQGQTAEIRFPAFKYRTAQLVSGKVFYVAADRTLVRATNQAYYVAPASKPTRRRWRRPER